MNFAHIDTNRRSPPLQQFRHRHSILPPFDHAAATVLPGVSIQTRDNYLIPPPTGVRASTILIPLERRRRQWCGGGDDGGPAPCHPMAQMIATRFPFISSLSFSTAGGLALEAEPNDTVLEAGQMIKEIPALR
ncbi:unnamed protein product [Linum trigynum]|uniref:Uncharacterized protein n=1 Tax=Linum trigynum TaxID=586398 RepID=A0AAV2GKB3_9ROSI